MYQSCPDHKVKIMAKNAKNVCRTQKPLKREYTWVCTSSPVTIFPTVRRAGIRTDGDGWLKNPHNKRIAGELEHLDTMEKRRIKEVAHEQNWLRCLKHTEEAQQVLGRHQLQWQLEFCHLYHQRDTKEPSMHQ